MKLHQALRKHRIQAGITQQKLADLLNHKTPQFISNVERGVCKMPLDCVKQYLDIIKFPYEIYKQELMDEFDAKVSSYFGKDDFKYKPRIIKDLDYDQ